MTSTGFVRVVGSGSVDLTATYQGVVGSIHLSVSLPRTFSVFGVVQEGAPSSGPIENARVQIVGGEHTFSDDHGAFILVGLPEGRTIIEVSKNGYRTWTKDVVVDGAQLVVTLYPTSGSASISR